MSFFILAIVSRFCGPDAWSVKRLVRRLTASGLWRECQDAMFQRRGGPTPGQASTFGGGTDWPLRPTRTQGTPVQDVSFALLEGEVLGIYGLLGAGRTELLDAIAGARGIRSGTIRLRDKKLRVKSARDAVRAGIHLVPEDRQRDALVPDLSVRENIALASAGGCFLDKTNETARALQLVKDLNIRVSDLELPVTALSGGNQQKVIIARCLMCSPKLLLLDEPTRGVDVGAKAEIYAILNASPRRGSASSSPLPKLRRYRLSPTERLFCVKDGSLRRSSAKN